MYKAGTVYPRLQGKRGTTFIDVLFGVSLLLLVFMGIFGAFRLAIELVISTKAKTGAIALANEQMEFVRSLSYDDVGTQGGIPSGAILQNENIALNQTNYIRRTFIQYIDAADDGLGAADTNGLTADYKVVKVELTWDVKGIPRSLALISNIVPRGIESVAGGGTLTISVIDALAQPVSSAEVHITNATTSPPVDVTTFTDVNGSVSFPGAPAASEYQITVTKDGLSTAQTYDATISNPNPNPAHLSVVAGNTTSSTFAIDLLSSKTVRTFEPIRTSSLLDSFTDSSLLTSSQDVTVSGGDVTLFDTGNGFELDGFVVSTTTTSQYLVNWEELTWGDTTPNNTNITYQVLYFDGFSFVPIPDTALFGNELGFSSSPVDLTSLATTTYGTLRVRGDLTTNDASTTPTLSEWELSYREGPIPLPDIPFAMQGTKTIGTDGGGAPVYKFTAAFDTGSTATVSTTTLEWDTYTITIDNVGLNYDISESCTAQPRSLLPGAGVTTDLVLVPHSANSLLVAVTDVSGNPLVAPTIRLYRTPYDETQAGSSCGQTFFGSLSQGTVSGGSPYSLDVSLTGYQSVTRTDVDVDGNSQIIIVLNPL